MSKRDRTPSDEEVSYLSLFVPELLTAIIKYLLPLDLLDFSRSSKKNSLISRPFKKLPINIAILTKSNPFQDVYDDFHSIEFYTGIYDDDNPEYYRLIYSSISLLKTNPCYDSMVEVQLSLTLFPLWHLWNGCSLPSSLDLTVSTNKLLLDTRLESFLFIRPLTKQCCPAIAFTKVVIYWRKDHSDTYLEYLLLSLDE